MNTDGKLAPGAAATASTGRGIRRVLCCLALLFGRAEAVEQDVQTAEEFAPERIDVVFSRLARQGRTLDALLEIVQKLEKVAQHSNAAAALLSHEGEPTDRLRSALVEVAEQRERPREAPSATVDASARALDGLRPDIVYAQTMPGGAPRVLVSVGGARFAAAEGHAIIVGADTIRVLAIRRADTGVDVELSVNGGAPFVSRAGR